MTHEEWTKLTPIQKRDIVAELGGWFKKDILVGSRRIKRLAWYHPDKLFNHDKPTDYTKDQNAIIDLVNKQDSLGFWNRYVSCLNRLVNGIAKDWKEQEDYFNTSSQFKLINASAERRAEAFVLVMTE